MQAATLNRLGRRALVLLLVLALLALALVKSHVHRIFGGYVERVDPGAFRVERARIAITGVGVLSPDGENMLEDRTVVIEGGRIVSVEEGSRPIDAARLVDGRGKFLIPGLVDAHVHLRKQPNDLLLYVANGVTHVRHFSGTEADLEMRREIENGRIGPRLYVTSPLLFTAGPVSGWFAEFTEPRFNVRRAADAEAVVRTMAAAGYDALKTYADIDLDVYGAINRAAAEIGMHTVGHLPAGLRLEELAVTEQREIAHIEELVKPLQIEYRASGGRDYGNEFPEFVAGRADAIIDDLLANDITVNSTLWLMEAVGQQAFDLKAALRALPLEYANPAMVEGSPYVPAVGWLPGRNQFESPSDSSPETRARIERSWEARAEAHRVLHRRMVERGVRIVAGTDATSHLVIAGFSLHDELESLVRNGMTPAQALRAATATPAALMGSDAGAIKPGRRADLVLLSGNPLDDIENTTSIEAVVVDGRLLDRKMLDRMLAAVREAHAASRKFDLRAYQ